jgi:thiosulfate dehydrogenase (quinone) large subunit
MLTRAARYLLASIQLIIGWEWFVSGTNKVLSGNFPQSLLDTLNSGIQNNPNSWYITFLQKIVVPNSVSFGYLVEWTEVMVGLALLVGAIILVGKPRMRGDSQHAIVIAVSVAVILLAAVGAFFTVNFHFWMGHGIIPGIGAAPTDEGIDLDALIPPFALVIIIANLAWIKALRGETWYSQLYAETKSGLRKFIGMEDTKQVEQQKSEVVS